VIEIPNVRVNPPPCPCTVIETVPVGVALLVTMVSVDPAVPFEGGVTLAGLKPVPASTWLPGRFNTVRLTALLKPPMLWTVTEYVVLCPCVTV
jgi:hypothetical protein